MKKSQSLSFDRIVESVQFLHFVVTVFPSIFVYFLLFTLGVKMSFLASQYGELYLYLHRHKKKSFADKTVPVDHRTHVLMNDFAFLDEEHRCKDYFANMPLIKQLRIANFILKTHS